MSNSVKTSIISEFSSFVDSKKQSNASASVLIVLRVYKQSLQVLLTLRSEQLRSHPGQWALPGGKMDLGESSQQAVLRECEEEVGLQFEQIELVGLFDHFQSKDGLGVDVWLGLLTDDAFLPVLNEDEVQQIKWLNLEYVFKKPDRIEQMQRQGVLIDIPFYDVLTPSLWGLTAMILRKLCKQLDSQMNDLPVLQMLLSKK